MFGPASRELLIIALCLAVLFIAVAVYALGKRRRVLTVILSFFSALLLLVSGGIGMNRNLGYATSWRNVPALFGIGGSAGAVVPVEHQRYRVGEAPAIDRHEGDKRWDATFTTENGTLQKTTFTGPHSKLTLPVWVWKPANYKADPSRPARVIVMLHGFPGNPKKIAEQLGFDSAGESLANTIVVMPSLQVDSRSPDCVDIKGRPQVGTWVTQDVTQMIAHNFPEVSSDRKDWVMSGASAGGYCALALGLTYPHLYERIVAFSGYNDAETGLLRKANLKLKRAFKISQLASQQTQWEQKIYATGTKKDSPSLELLDELKKAAPVNISLDTFVGSGGHNWKVWSTQLAGVLTWMKEDS